MHHHHHHFGHHHHHFGHHHHGHHFGHHRHGFGNPGLGALAIGATAGLAAGALVGSALARPSARYGSPQVMPVPPVVVAPVVPFSLTNPAPVAQIALGVHSIRLQIGSQERGVQFFAIDVFPSNGGNPWRVLRRYNQFHDLSRALNAYRQILTPFPRKHLSGCHGSKLESRRRGLETWLASVIAACPSVPAWTFLLKNFLEASERPANQVSIPQVAYSEPSAPPVEESLPLHAPPIEVPPQQGETSEGMIMEVTVPLGVSPGQMLDVALPGGRQMMLEIPQGTVAGQVLEVWYDPAQNSLRPLM